jgi:hypothetical protein
MVLDASIRPSGKLYVASLLGFRRLSCPSCGNPKVLVALVSCANCELPIYRDAVTIEGVDDEGGKLVGHFHQWCVEPARNSGNRVIATSGCLGILAVVLCVCALGFFLWISAATSLS